MLSESYLSMPEDNLSFNPDLPFSGGVLTYSLQQRSEIL